MSSILITGACGFVGHHFIEAMTSLKEYDKVVVVDKGTYAAINEDVIHNSNVIFFKDDICNSLFMNTLFHKYKFDSVVNFAAESHVDNSIRSSLQFTQTNVLGTQTLLDAAKMEWDQTGYEGKKFIQISTDEVYGSLGINEQPFTEYTPIDPNSPYSATKAGADLLVQSYVKTHGFPACITRCSNNYGPRQHEEKLIPTVIHKALNDEPIPVYGDGSNVRDWIHVLDHVSAIIDVLRHGKLGEVYNVGGKTELTNLELIHKILDIMGKPHSLIEFVEDRKGHDQRYAVDFEKIASDLGWYPLRKMDKELKNVIESYI